MIWALCHPSSRVTYRQNPAGDLFVTQGDKNPRAKQSIVRAHVYRRDEHLWRHVSGVPGVVVTSPTPSQGTPPTADRLPPSPPDSPRLVTKLICSITITIVIIIIRSGAAVNTRRYPLGLLLAPLPLLPASCAHDTYLCFTRRCSPGVAQQESAAANSCGG